MLIMKKKVDTNNDCHDFLVFVLKILAAVALVGIVSAIIGIAIRENERNNNE